MKRLAYIVAAVSMVLTGCGGSVCEDLADAGEALAEKSCDGGSAEEPTEAEIEECEEELENCSGDDKEAISEFASCVQDLPECTTATEDNFNAAFVGCAVSHLSNLSEACLAVSGESLRHAATSSRVR